MRPLRYLLGTLAGVMLAVAVSFAAADQQPVPPVARVTDTTGTLSADQKQAIEGTLTALEQRKGSQVAVLFIATTQPETIEEYSYRVADTWKLGRKGTDDGVLITIAKDDHKARIEVGRGLEGAITDADSSRIIRGYMQPKFRAGDFYGGLTDALNAVIKLIDGEPLPAPLDNKHSQPSMPPGALLPFMLFGLVAVRGWVGALPSTARAVLMAGGGAVVAWIFTSSIIFALMAAGIGGFIGWLGLGGGSGWSSGGGGWSSGGGGWSGGSSSGGGGFSGGGGGFAGGGASGSW